MDRRWDACDFMDTHVRYGLTCLITYLLRTGLGYWLKKAEFYEELVMARWLGPYDWAAIRTVFEKIS